MNIGVVGAGWWGKNVINSLRQIDSVESITIFDSDLSALNKYSDLTKVKSAKCIDDIKNNKKISSVCIATPPNTHYELTKLFLTADKNIFIEKPPANSVEQVIELGKIAERNQKVYMLDALYLFLEPMKKLKEILESGELTKINLFQIYRIGDELRREGAGLSRIERSMFDNSVDVFEDLFFHDAGILLYLFNNIEFQSVEKLYLYNDKICDTARIRFAKNNLTIELLLSWTLTGRRRGISIYDKNFIIEYDGLSKENQLSKFTLSNFDKQYFSFQQNPPLISILEYFIATILNNDNNFLGYDFMLKLMSLWEIIKRE